MFKHGEDQKVEERQEIRCSPAKWLGSVWLGMFIFYLALFCSVGETIIIKLINLKFILFVHTRT